jgi:hypothetical protein
MKCVALDMDETLGHFAQASMLWSAARRGDITLSNPELVACILEVPGIFNPDLANVLKLLRRGLASGHVSEVVVYTNNVGDREWAEIVATAANIIAGDEVISDVIAGYRGHGDVNEPRRTTSRKTVEDLERCAPSEHYVFVDNDRHRGMISPKVDYIKVDPHIVTVDAEEYDAAVCRALGDRRGTTEGASRFMGGKVPRAVVGGSFSQRLATVLGMSRSQTRSRRDRSGGRRTRRLG